MRCHPSRCTGLVPAKLCCALGVCCTSVQATPISTEDESRSARSTADATPEPPTDSLRAESSPIGRPCRWPCYVHTFVGVGIGKGLRLNNPFRLQTQLGASAESLSATATTLELELAALLGDPVGWHHGFGVSGSVALEGVPQQVVAPSYEVGVPLSPRFWWRGRAGIGFVTQPDFNAGIELGSQLVMLASAGLGGYVGVAYGHYWGAATDETQATTIPVMALQLGATMIYEVLP